jgi:peptidoglycan/LPS O-acetylase OafA/YrhL
MIPGGQSQGQNRLAYLDGLRSLAALYVLVHHAFMTAHHARLRGTPEYVAYGWAIWGHYGVTVFIVLAGYSLAYGVANRGGHLPGGFWGFVRKRSWRIIPPYWIALALTVVLAATILGRATNTHWDQSIPPTPKGWLADALLLQDVVPIRNAAYTFWSVSVEYHIYVLLPIILLLWRRWNIAVGVGLAGLVGILGIAGGYLDHRYARFFPEYYLLFALAAGSAIVVRRYPDIAARLPWRTGFWVFLATGVATLSISGYEWVSGYWFPDVALGAAVVCLIGTLAQGKFDATNRILSWRWFAVVATFSYSLYLIHAQLLQLFWQLAIEPFDLSTGWQIVLVWAVFCPIIVVIAWAFSLVAEQPFVRKAAGRPLRKALPTNIPPDTLSSGRPLDPKSFS